MLYFNKTNDKDAVNLDRNTHIHAYKEREREVDLCSNWIATIRALCFHSTFLLWHISPYLFILLTLISHCCLSTYANKNSCWHHRSSCSNYHQVAFDQIIFLLVFLEQFFQSEKKKIAFIILAQIKWNNLDNETHYLILYK